MRIPTKREGHAPLAPLSGPSRLFQLASKRAITGILLAMGIGALAIAALPAHAQGVTVNPQTVGAIRLGVYLPSSSHVTSPVGKYFPVGGLDYTFQQSDGNRAQVSLDYTERSSSGSDVRVIPLTVSDLFYSGPRAGGVREYWGVGTGVYFVHVHVPNPISSAGIGAPSQQTVNGTDEVFGGFLAAGIELPQNVFLDARYHIDGEVDHVSTSGLEVTAGYRF